MSIKSIIKNALINAFLKTCTIVSMAKDSNIIEISDTTGLLIGERIEGAGIPLNTCVTAITDLTHITMNNAATQDLTAGTLKFYIPVFFQVYTGSTFPAISFFQYLEQGEAWAENKETDTGHYIQVDLWSKAPEYEDIAGQIKAALENIEFFRTSAQDLYENDTNIFHKAMRFVNVESTQ